MKRRFFFVLIGGLALVLAVMLWLELAGSAVVVDETGGVASAAIVDGSGRAQPLTELWSGYFYAIPNLEGSIEIRCRDGSRRRRGYVTGQLHTKLRVVGSRPCERILEVVAPLCTISPSAPDHGCKIAVLRA